MKHNLVKFVSIAASACVLGLGGQGYAQQDAGTPIWAKACNTIKQTKKEFCLTSQEIRAGTGQFLASVAIRDSDEGKKQTLSVAVPLGMLLQPGIVLQIDQNKQRNLKYGICNKSICISEQPVGADMVAEMKRGNKIVLTTFNQAAEAITFELSLSGFTASYDGPPIDPAELKARQQLLAQERQKAADAARQKLIDQQNKATSGN